MGFRFNGSGFGVQGTGFRAQGSWFRIQGSGFRVQGSVFRVQGSGSRVQDSVFRVQGLGFRGGGARIPGNAGEAVDRQSVDHRFPDTIQCDSYGRHGVGGFVGEDGGRFRERERGREGKTTGFEAVAVHASIQRAI